MKNTTKRGIPTKSRSAPLRRGSFQIRGFVTVHEKTEGVLKARETLSFTLLRKSGKKIKRRPSKVEAMAPERVNVRTSDKSIA